VYERESHFISVIKDIALSKMRHTFWRSLIHRLSLCQVQILIHTQIINRITHRPPVLFLQRSRWSERFIGRSCPFCLHVYFSKSINEFRLNVACMKFWQGVPKYFNFVSCWSAIHYKNVILPVVLYGCETFSHPEMLKYLDGVWEQGAAVNIGRNMRVDKTA
jgi:hypothetical protein